MSQKGVWFGVDEDIQLLAEKLKKMHYKVGGGQNIIILRPKLKKNIEGSLFNRSGFFLYVNKVTLIHRGEYIFIKIKWNYFLLFTGIIFLLLLIDKAKDLDYASYFKIILMLSLIYFFVVWRITVFIRNYVKRDIKASMTEKAG